MPADKKNKKSLSKKKLTKEEKAAKKIEIQNELLRHQFEREAKFCESSEERGADHHLLACQNLTLERLSNELNTQIQSLNRFLDRSEHQVGVIEVHRNHAEEQHQRLFAFHAHLVDWIFSLFNLFHDTTRQLYEDERDRLVASFYEASINQERIQHERRIYYENFAHASVSLMKSRLSSVDEKLTERKVEIESWSVEHRDLLADKKLRLENLACREIKSILKLFTQKLWPEERLEEYEKMVIKEKRMNQDTEKICKNIKISGKCIKKLREEIDIVERQKLMKRAELKSEQKFMQKILSIFESKLKDEERADKEKLRNLVIASDGAKQKMLKLLEKARHIESKMKICSKYEKSNDFFRCKSFEELSCVDDLTSHFFLKLSQVESDVVFLRSCKSQLIADQQNMRQLIDQFEHQNGLEYNYQLLNLNSSPSVGSISQIAHQMPQIKEKLTKMKLYQQHMDFFAKHRKNS